MFSKLDNFQLSLLIGHFDSSLHWMRFGFLLWFRFLHLNKYKDSVFGLSKISVNLFDGQFTCWAICLEYHILTYGHITAGHPANISFCVWGVAADDRNAIDDDDYDGDDDDESDLKIWVAPAASTAAVTRSFPPTATGSALRMLVMMMIVVVLMMVMLVMVVVNTTKRLTAEMMM